MTQFHQLCINPDIFLAQFLYLLQNNHPVLSQSTSAISSTAAIPRSSQSTTAVPPSSAPPSVAQPSSPVPFAEQLQNAMQEVSQMDMYVCLHQGLEN